MSDKKQVLVTGASGGIGSAIAEAVAQAGYAVVAGYNRGKTRVDELIQRVQAAGGEIRGLQLDISDREQCKEVLAKDIEENGTYYGLILNAGVCADMTFAGMSGDSWDKVVNTNNRGQVNYSASKAGLIGASKALATELASRGITVNSVAPGVIETEMIKDAPLDIILQAVPMKRVGKPSEVAATAVFLLSEGAAYITRQVISVNGGLA